MELKYASANELGARLRYRDNILNMDVAVENYLTNRHGISTDASWSGLGASSTSGPAHTISSTMTTTTDGTNVYLHDYIQHLESTPMSAVGVDSSSAEYIDPVFHITSNITGDSMIINVNGDFSYISEDLEQSCNIFELLNRIQRLETRVENQEDLISDILLR